MNTVLADDKLDEPSEELSAVAEGAVVGAKVGGVYRFAELTPMTGTENDCVS